MRRKFYFEKFLRGTGLEPACLAALPPQDSVSASSTTRAKKNYLAFGASVFSVL
jgi:hypothetical protein